MGNQDNWSTPKQIKIERAGEPRGIKRGKLKKGERRKGKKARIDEVLSAKKSCETYKKYCLDDEKRRKERPEWYTQVEGKSRRYDPEYRKWFTEYQTKLLNLIGKAIRDGVFTEEDAKQYEVSLCVR